MGFEQERNASAAAQRLQRVGAALSAAGMMAGREHPADEAIQGGKSGRINKFDSPCLSNYLRLKSDILPGLQIKQVVKRERGAVAVW